MYAFLNYISAFVVFVCFQKDIYLKAWTHILFVSLTLSYLLLNKVLTVYAASFSYLLTEFYDTRQEALGIFLLFFFFFPQFVWYLQQLFFFPGVRQVKVLYSLQANLSVQAALPQPLVLPCACFGAWLQDQAPRWSPGCKTAQKNAFPPHYPASSY